MNEMPAKAVGSCLPIVAFALLVVASATPAMSQPSCADAATQVDMNACHAQTYKESDDGLNRAYGALRQRLSGDTEALDLLTKAQRAWIAFRDAQCAYSVSKVAGGSLYPTAMATCLADMTRQRTSEIETLAKCEEGDIACPSTGP